ncbi:MAG: ARPP-1 family domain-containing protein, partial [Blastocatellia bacterium]
MKRQTLTIGLFLIAVSVGLIGAFSTSAQRQAAVAQPQNPIPANYTFSGPYTHKNLTIFLLHGADQSKGRAPLTLQEAMKQKKVVVRETGEVNELTIQNRSNEEVFVQAGDIVKGGQQDRVLALDLIVPPKSGRIPIEAFCVEHGRWSRRGNEAVAAFSASNNMLASKELKIAAKAKGSQDEVWANVSKAQAKLAENVVVADSAPATARARRGAGRVEGASLGGASAGALSATAPVALPADRIEDRRAARVLGAHELDIAAVVSAASPSSLQLTLENKLVKD